jgi:hypothetical protein
LSVTDIGELLDRSDFAAAAKREAISMPTSRASAELHTETESNNSSLAARLLAPRRRSFVVHIVQVPPHPSPAGGRRARRLRAVRRRATAALFVSRQKLVLCAGAARKF